MENIFNMVKVSMEVRRGMTLVEVAIAMSVIAIGLMAVISAVMSMSQLSLANEEDLLALNIARQKIAELKDAPFNTVFNLYGPNSSMRTSNVGALQRGTLDGGTVTIMFPVNAAGALDETVVDASLGMPQDLNGNGSSTDTDVSGSYTVLPVRIRVQWNSRTGARELNLITMLTKLK